MVLFGRFGCLKQNTSATFDGLILDTPAPQKIPRFAQDFPRVDRTGAHRGVDGLYGRRGAGFIGKRWLALIETDRPIHR